MFSVICVLAVLAHQALATNTTCGLNEVYFECGPQCPQNCNVRASECKKQNECGESGCYCKKGYVRYNKVCREAKTVCCPKNEIFSCGSACQNECSKLGEICPIQTLVCVEDCFCIDGYARDANNKCIPESQCPPKIPPTCTRPYEHYDSCAEKFEPTCSNRSPNGCGGSKCYPKCVCNDGFVRDENGRCVKPYECSNNNENTCKRNQIFQTCGNPCQATCDIPNPPLCKAACRPGCFCKEGYLYNDATSSCVRPSQCPNSENQNCKRNQVYQTCGNPCQGTCDNPDLPLVCRAPCRPGCFCKEGYLFNAANNMCVRPSQCPGSVNQQCKRNEVYQTCGNPCQGTCDNPDLPLVCRAPCRPGCFCKEGYLYNTTTNSCVRPSQCSTGSNQVCKRNEIYQTCGNPCQGTCDNPDRPLTCKIGCRPGCFCKEGYLLNEANNMCIRASECSNVQNKVCKRNEIFQSCGNPCQGTCAKPDLPTVCRAICGPGCYCKEGFLYNERNDMCVRPENCKL